MIHTKLVAIRPRVVSLFEKEYRHEINSLNEKLKFRGFQLELIRALRYVDAKKYQDATTRGHHRLSYLEKAITSISKIRDQHGAKITDQKREI